MQRLTAPQASLIREVAACEAALESAPRERRRPGAGPGGPAARIVCERGVGTTTALLAKCAADSLSGYGSLFVVSRLAAEQVREALGGLAHVAGGSRWAVVASSSEVDSCAAAAARPGAAGLPGLLVVSDTMYRPLVRRLTDILGGRIPLFARAVFDDAPALRIPACPEPPAAVSWLVTPAGPAFGAGRGRGFIASSLAARGGDPPACVWLDGTTACSGAAPAEGMFVAAPTDEEAAAVSWRACPWRPSGSLETSLVIMQTAESDPDGASRLMGALRPDIPGWRGYVEGGDRTCPVCLSDPDDLRGSPAAAGVLRARTRCCGREFCASCLAGSLAARAGRGLPPSCPQCRDELGACLEACEPVVVEAGGGGRPATTRPPRGGGLPMPTLPDGVSREVRQALATPGSVVLVVASVAGSDALCSAGWFRQACAGAGRLGGFERIAGSAKGFRSALRRLESGARRVAVVEAGPASEVGVRLPWVTHVVMMDCASGSRHWLRRTDAAPVATATRPPGCRGRAVSIHRMVSAYHYHVLRRGKAGGRG